MSDYGLQWMTFIEWSVAEIPDTESSCWYLPNTFLFARVNHPFSAMEDNRFAAEGIMQISQWTNSCYYKSEHPQPQHLRSRDQRYMADTGQEENDCQIARL